MKKTSIILTSWNKTQFHAACGMTTIAAVRAFTDPKEYELIIIETIGIPMRDFHKNLDLGGEKHIVREMHQDKGNSADMNEGAEMAEGDYFCFIQNDVIVHPGWLPTLRYYLDNDLADAVVPNQIMQPFAQMQEWENQSHEDTAGGGMQDAGMILIRRDKFEEAGGWDERMRKVLMWKVFQYRLARVGVRIMTTHKTTISHIGGASYWWDIRNNKEEHERHSTEESKIMQKEYVK